ncbi:beta-1,2-xylosyltransferase-like [Glycine soja]|uniref:Beta-(1,2)-xylosyltransferase n=1 Tax=Glycine soja TaxID=3848 RepID=A0A445FQU4_GLYSO|nr:beta-1,2-xylosyltransferase-like [Glycine soja]RZB51245.1 Beta-(1,2)-xylosyltransferase [Glycine soja]
MNKRTTLLIRTLLFLFVLNSLYLSLYFTHKPSYSSPSEEKEKSELEPDTYLTPFSHEPHSSKPWPILPSYLPWTTSARSHSCEAYFGNGFTRRRDALLPRGGAGWFRCHHNDALRSSVCEGGRLRMAPEKITMAKGGEDLAAVMGRTEDEEMPVFQNGAFQVDGGEVAVDRKVLVDQEFLDEYVPRGGIDRHTMRDLIAKIRIVRGKDFQCDEWIEEPTLLVTRFEYANLFHTVTDWYSAYVSSRVTALPNRPHVIFVDGHCKAPLEETWKALFSSVRYAKSFSGSVCFHHAILSPLGYETAMFRGLSEHIDCYGAPAQELLQNPNDHKTARLSEFGEMVRAAFGLPLNVNHDGKSLAGHNVLFVRREDYLAHPRHSGKLESRLSNEQEVFDSLKSWASNYKGCKINLVNGLFAHMSMKDQVQAIHDASVIIGAHGAGLTHIVSALPKTVILEIISSYYRRPHFAYISRWRGLEYHAINLAGSHADPGAVIKELANIMKSLGC